LSITGKAKEVGKAVHGLSSAGADLKA